MEPVFVHYKIQHRMGHPHSLHSQSAATLRNKPHGGGAGARKVGIVEGYWTPLAAHQGAMLVSHLTPRDAEEVLVNLGHMRRHAIACASSSVQAATTRRAATSGCSTRQYVCGSGVVIRPTRRGAVVRCAPQGARDLARPSSAGSGARAPRPRAASRARVPIASSPLLRARSARRSRKYPVMLSLVMWAVLRSLRVAMISRSRARSADQRCQRASSFSAIPSMRHAA